MAYNNVTDRSDASALIPEEVSDVLLKGVESESFARSTFTPVPVARGQLRCPVLSALPIAYFKNGDTGLAQTTQMAWDNKYIDIEEADVIFPAPNSVVDDMEDNLWDEATPLMTQALGRLIDNAVLFGVNAPSSWPTNIAAAAAAAGNTTNEGSAASAGGYFNDIDSLYELVEDDGFSINGWAAAISAKSKLRKARDSQGRKLDEGRVNGSVNNLDGFDIHFPVQGEWLTSSGSERIFGGDWTQFAMGIRKDISMKVLTEAVIQDNTGKIIFNLAQQGMTAVMLTFRLGWQVANGINWQQQDEDNRYPVAALTIP